MATELVHHTKVTDEKGNTLEIKIWKISKPTKDKPHGYRYSLVYIVDGKRVVGYDNGERKGDHRHMGNEQEDYEFTSIDKLFNDFYEDVRRFLK
ncbi:MAG: DUF6516 family protein [Proteobacteria bacterium]|nr:DUF6516 family protein [Pseudomonadota bacterium]MCX5855875.1 DUF6516 family protein [Deltaproteobacteria bacterium]